MNIKEKVALLKMEVIDAKDHLGSCVKALAEAESDIQNHTYESLEEAENFLFSMFERQAYDDCEGAGNCGCEEYTQDFIVDGKEYTATGSFEYDRHDKTYYYVDRHSYSYKEKQND